MALDPSTGAVVAQKYRLDSLLGEGGYGAVWRGTQLSVGRAVAIKFLKSGLLDEDALRRFRREAKALGRLQHPGCVTLIDFGDDPEFGLFLVTEFLDGIELTQWLRHGPHTLDVLLDICSQVLDALAHAHENRIVHRDLKPANIMVLPSTTGRQVAKVLDFGISGVMGSKRGSITKTGDVFGTPGYMSPEQLRGEEVGPPADLYAFGVVMFQMLEGRRPFEGASSVEVMMKHMTEPAPDLLQSGEALAAFVTRLLQKEPQQRFANARQAQEALRQAQQGVVQGQAQVPAGFAGRARATPPMSTLRNAPGSGHAMALTPRQIAAVGVGLFALLVLAAWGTVAYLETAAPPVAQAPIPTEPAPPHVQAVRLPPVPTRTQDRPEEPVEAAPELLTGCDDGEPFPPGLQTIDMLISVTEGKESAIVYIPHGYTPDKQHRVAVMFHDTRQTPAELIDEGGFAARADRDDVVIVLPEHPDELFPWERKDDYARARADLELARELLCLQDRVDYYGHGSGGHAASEFACKDQNTGAWAVSAFREEQKVLPCGAQARPHLLISPLEDGRDPVDGGVGCMGGMQVKSLADHEAMMRKTNRCSDARKKLKTDYREGDCYTWACEVSFESCHVRGGRPWAGRARRRHQCEGRSTMFPYGQAVWDFLKRAADAPTSQ